MITSDFWVQFKATLDSEAFWDTLDVTADIEQRVKGVRVDSLFERQASMPRRVSYVAGQGKDAGR